jgi:hypothetical protein
LAEAEAEADGRGGGGGTALLSSALTSLCLPCLRVSSRVCSLLLSSSRWRVSSATLSAAAASLEALLLLPPAPLPSCSSEPGLGVSRPLCSSRLCREDTPSRASASARSAAERGASASLLSRLCLRGESPEALKALREEEEEEEAAEGEPAELLPELLLRAAAPPELLPPAAPRASAELSEELGSRAAARAMALLALAGSRRPSAPASTASTCSALLVSLMALSAACAAPCTTLRSELLISPGMPSRALRAALREHTLALESALEVSAPGRAEPLRATAAEELPRGFLEPEREAEEEEEEEAEEELSLTAEELPGDSRACAATWAPVEGRARASSQKASRATVAASTQEMALPAATLTAVTARRSVRCRSTVLARAAASLVSTCWAGALAAAAGPPFSSAAAATAAREPTASCRMPVPGCSSTAVLSMPEPCEPGC